MAGIRNTNYFSHHGVGVVRAKDRNIDWRCVIGHAKTNAIWTILFIVEPYDGR